MDAGRSFDEAARSAEIRLAELRRLLAGETAALTPEQEAALALLTETLAGIEQSALALRNAVLNAPETPASFVERVYERLPEGFDPSGWITETYVTPVTAAWGNEFAEKPGGEITVDSLFEGADDLDEGDPTSRVPVAPRVPVRPGGDERTFEEALAEPRNP